MESNETALTWSLRLTGQNSRANTVSAVKLDDTVSAAPSSPPPHRLASLDGLRGVASLVVVVNHSLLTIPAVAAIFYAGAPTITAGSALWFAAYTPLHLFWGGTESVYLFFVLSGIVLVLPVLRSPRFAYLGYYPRRIIRLYGPVLAAVAFALITVVLVPRSSAVDLGPWMNSRPSGYSLSGFLRDATLVTGSSGFVSPLWTLRWEVLFSLLLPFYVWAVRSRRWGALALAVAVGCLALGSAADNDPLFFLSIFGVGAIAIAHWDRVAAVGAATDRHRYAWPAVVALAVLLTTSRWDFLGAGMPRAVADRLEWVSVLGVALIVFCAALWSPIRAALESRVAQWLGRVSFSLYLVHEPIIIALRFTLVSVDPWVTIALAIPLSLGVSALFARLVEMPLHRLARATGIAVSRRTASSSAG